MRSPRQLLAWRPILDSSSSLATMMYQVPTDMMTMMTTWSWQRRHRPRPRELSSVRIFNFLGSGFASLNGAGAGASAGVRAAAGATAGGRGAIAAGHLGENGQRCAHQQRRTHQPASPRTACTRIAFISMDSQTPFASRHRRFYDIAHGLNLVGKGNVTETNCTPRARR